MIFRLIACFFLLTSLYSCENHDKKSTQNTVKKIDTSKVKPLAIKKAELLTPVAGYRFVITGDFNGDGKQEQLSEHFFSGIDHKETNKFYKNGDYDTLVALTNKRKTYSFLSCSDKSIGNLSITTKPQLGLAYLKNEGDLNGDGTDEISYVVNWADWSNLNSWYIMTYKHGNWKTLYVFSIWDWQLPDIPETYNEIGIAGRENFIINNTDSAANKNIAENLKNFKGLVKKTANNKIQIIYMTDEAEMDTAIVNLNKPSQKPKSTHKSKH